eukprot:14985802-Alexandrium_andersonii.AAC.1
MLGGAPAALWSFIDFQKALGSSGELRGAPESSWQLRGDLRGAVRSAAPSSLGTEKLGGLR